MFNLNDVNSPKNFFAANRLLGKLVRLPLKLIPKNMVLPILQGPGIGLKWMVGSYNHGCWLGFYEYEKQIVIKDIIKKGDVVYDIGAHVGYFTIIFSKLVGSAGHVYAFEPFEANFEFIKQHLKLNNQSNVDVYRAGVGSANGVARFLVGAHSATGKLNDEGSFEFPVYELISFIKKNKLIVPTFIKMDIEGEEINVLPALVDYMYENRITLLVSTHSDDITARLVSIFYEKAFKVKPLQWSNQPQNKSVENASLLLVSL